MTATYGRDSGSSSIKTERDFILIEITSPAGFGLKAIVTIFDGDTGAKRAGQPGLRQSNDDRSTETQV